MNKHNQTFYLMSLDSDSLKNSEKPLTVYSNGITFYLCVYTSFNI